MPDLLLQSPSLTVLVELARRTARDEALTNLEALPIVSSSDHEPVRRAYLAQITRDATRELGRAALSLGYIMAVDLKATGKLSSFPPVPAYMRGLASRSYAEARIAEAARALGSAVRLYAMVASLQALLSAEEVTPAGVIALAETAAILVTRRLRQGAAAAEAGRALEADATSLV